MAPVATPFFFYLFAAIMLIGGIAVITRKNPVHSALALIVALLAQASLYLMLYAPFVAGVQIILYAGGIMVLFLFVIMLINIDRSMKERQFNKQWLIGIVDTKSRRIDCILRTRAWRHGGRSRAHARAGADPAVRHHL